MNTEMKDKFSELKVVKLSDYLKKNIDWLCNCTNYITLYYSP